MNKNKSVVRKGCFCMCTYFLYKFVSTVFLEGRQENLEELLVEGGTGDWESKVGGNIIFVL